ncbi:hypothetical protein JOB18_002588 [Solea senegalensis]|uniref:Uncharacterized protein n=1 Tax=Solea senegalensis TaxID=28829 RepID=A0AAV6R7Z5_SOLSE|nr:hypothetical protein JOB18_002588 [Solea senegalensis]
MATGTGNAVKPDAISSCHVSTTPSLPSPGEEAPYSRRTTITESRSHSPPFRKG